MNFFDYLVGRQSDPFQGCGQNLMGDQLRAAAQASQDDPMRILGLGKLSPSWPRPMYYSDIFPTPGEVIDGDGRTVKRLVLEGDLYGRQMPSRHSEGEVPGLPGTGEGGASTHSG